MPLLLKPNETCHYATNCPYNSNVSSICKGADSSRSTQFVCDLVSDSGVFTEGKFRSKFDETGKMKFISEGVSR